jgi:hypothetical protein
MRSTLFPLHKVVNVLQFLFDDGGVSLRVVLSKDPLDFF